MGLYTKLPDRINEMDVIVAGGCIIASRLVEADRGLSVLVIESGKNNYHEPRVLHPAFWPSHIAPGNEFTQFYQGPESDHMAGRRGFVPTAQVLGGGSSINTALYSRAVRSDFDSWNMSGWSTEDLEVYHGPGPRDRHGYEGPMQISGGPFRSTRLENEFIAALGHVGWPELEDNNDLDSVNGVMRAMHYIDPLGRRQDTAHMYLHPLLQDGDHPNLHVLVETQVERVLVENGTAVGVVHRANPVVQPSADGAQPLSQTTRAKRMVILAGGPFGSPLLLERSGIGNPQVLDRAGIPLVASLPGVGHDYLDHHGMIYPYKSTLGPEETMDALNSGRLDPATLIAKGDKLLGWNSVDAQAKLRPTDAGIAELGSEFQKAWERDFSQVPDKPLMMLSPFGGFPGDPSSIPAGQYFGMVAFSLHPYSRGHLHITGPNIDDPADFDPAVASDHHGLDIKNHVWMYKKQREAARRMEVYRGEVEGWHPSFPTSSQAYEAPSVYPLADVQDIEYSTDDDKIIEQWMRDHIDSIWHPMGTCKMGPLEERGSWTRRWACTASGG
ncbi:GMC oxidoreductase [Apiospora saccharicola]